MRTQSIALALFTIAALACDDDDGGALADAARAAHGEMAPAIPIIRVDNLRASQRYFRDVLGFKLEWEDGKPPDFAAVVRGDARFFLCQRCQGSGGSWSLVFVRNVDALYAEISGKGANVKMPPKDMPWRLREMHVADPDGNVIRFASATNHDS